MSGSLLDVNVLIALHDSFHPGYQSAHAWFGALGRRVWSTCPHSESGCIRIMSHPRYPSVSAIPGEVARRLRALCSMPNHEFWPADLTLLDESRFELQQVQGAKQLTDIYLLGLAVKHGGQLVTFDGTIPWRAVRGARASHLKLLVS